ncbi:hypothetical protein GJ496_001952 [Pomphorhynchus laevis]|nr:hypothetical protein GJ496_001952 [Pomphorhynchus laevis]
MSFASNSIFEDTIFESNFSLTIYGSVPNIKFVNSIFESNVSLTIYGGVPNILFYETTSDSNFLLNMSRNSTRLINRPKNVRIQHYNTTVF